MTIKQKQEELRILDSREKNPYLEEEELKNLWMVVTTKDFLRKLEKKPSDMWSPKKPVKLLPPKRFPPTV